MHARSVVHLIPYDGVGGVEEAARSLSGRQIPGIDFRIEYLFPNVRSRAGRAGTFNILQMLRVAVSLKREGPDVLILSLWRSVAVGLFVKLFRPSTRLILFLHNARDAHFADRTLTRLGARYSSAIWADSAATLAERLPKPTSIPTKVLSFVLRKPTPLHEPRDDDTPGSVFAFWGRFSAQKNIPRVLRVFSEIKKRVPNAQLLLIGATPAESEVWRERIRAAGLGQSVRVYETISFEEITKAVSGASFYLQTSHYEGMAMSVVEAMQLGLVPVVTPVGQIARYCRDGENAVLLPIDENDQEREKCGISHLVQLLSDGAPRWRRLRAAAISEWKNQKIYSDSFIDALDQLLVD
jgi:glycosyltransferase involved in cell wall biosynthesis